MGLYTHHLPAWKRKQVEEIKKDASSHALVGLVDMYGIPAAQLQQIRRNLKGSATIRMTRNTLIRHAFQEIGGSIGSLGEHISGHSALIFTNDNPFRLFKQLEFKKLIKDLPLTDNADNRARLEASDDSRIKGLAGPADTVFARPAIYATSPGTHGAAREAHVGFGDTLCQLVAV